MHSHGKRTAYYILDEGVFEEPAYLSGSAHGCPAGLGSSKSTTCSPFKFGRMFPRSVGAEWDQLVKGLIQLGLCMNDPAKYCNQAPEQQSEDSTIPSGYTYLGQFIAHEITFDNTHDLPIVEPDPPNLRSPSIDLDSLYGPDPPNHHSNLLYQEDNPALLKVGETLPPGELRLTLQNDLFRDKKTGRALIGDERNDENLALAQTTVALIKFHNKVVETLKAARYDADDLFECARKHVIRHFQWLILHDYLPTIVDKDVLDCVITHGLRWFKVRRPEDLYMPLEFSAAAFRFGHSMVRPSYKWNFYHPSGLGSTATPLSDLFDQTAFSGIIGESQPALRSDWVIDWRRFYDFPVELGRKPEWPAVNRARKLDTYFNFRLDQMSSFNHHDLPEEKQSITVRNLLRGFALGLPTGEEVAQWIGETPLRHEQVANGPHKALLSSSVFKHKTPLWYYILKEAELNGGSRLGRVGSRIVAETLVGLIKNSRYSIMDTPEWYPKYTRRGLPGTESAQFGIVDLLDFAGVVNPIGG